MKTVKLIFLLLFFLCLQYTFAQQSSWSSDNEGWILRKKPGSKKFEKFFAIGLWGIPGYTFSDPKEPESEKSNSKLFLEKTKNYNMLYVSPGKSRDYMKDLVQITGSSHFPYALNRYPDRFPAINKDTIISPYLRAQFIRKDIKNPKLKDKLDSTVNYLCKANSDIDYAWAPIDEISQGGPSGLWNWPSGVGDIINERIKNVKKDALVYTDLLGMGRGNSYLFEQLYLKTHQALPDTPPFELLSKEALECAKSPLLGFKQAYDGSPVYEFKNGKYSYKNYDLETLKRLWFENVKQCAAGFRKSGDVFGINAFRDFYASPILSGITVDAIKAGINSKVPVWLYFDGNGYAKPDNITAEEYVKNVKCQIYTSIIHGATGIMFWNDRSKTPEVFNNIALVIKEVKDDFPLIYSKTIEFKVNGDLHYMIKIDNKRRALIATNTSPTNSVSLNVKGFEKRSLKPLEVYITRF